MTRQMPLFPLGAVMFPGTALPLHVFEPRYRALMDDLTGAELGTPLITPEFGITLIERGHEVGGGDQRSRVGTVARLADAQRFDDGRWVALAGGVGRFRVETFLPDDPYPLAMVEELVDEPWGATPGAALADAETEVRRALALAVELEDGMAPVTFELDEDPATAAWQLCGLAPVGDLDRQRLLETGNHQARLGLVRSVTAEVAEVLAQRLSGR
ncbi:MAG: LON peptidase substrate-binding domain-containing protein [Actinomycetota bacterium]|nr:LON peptidase substrate-binding domain-containing protein [Actinomycetota bacterium]